MHSMHWKEHFTHCKNTRIFHNVSEKFLHGIIPNITKWQSSLNRIFTNSNSISSFINKQISHIGTSQKSHTSQCGNFIIFQSLRFHVKSILGIQEMQNLQLFFIFMKFCTFWRLKFIKLTKFWAPKWQKVTVLALLDSQKLISRKIWVIEKSCLNVSM